MIKSRQQKQVVEKKSTNNTENKKQPVEIKNSGPIGFKSWHEKTCAVLDRLEKEQGVYIYEEGRYGGMYLHRNPDKRFGHIFSGNQNQQNTQQDYSINKEDISKIFGSK